ncbi:MAG TPA: FKBP-type peptidyl-prolyl cis-trans isomerase [Steroidobacteraceae bacterium]|nr:FKBP-type peptidyl-prolyl cis-trans isomerase [Steroidobacteraceae bacterium]
MTLPAPRRGRTPFLVPAAAAALLACALPAPAQQPAAAAKAPADKAPAKAPAEGAAAKATSQRDATSYSLGVIMGEQLRDSGVTPEQISSPRVAQGVRDAINGKSKTSEADRKNMVELIRGAQEKLVDTNHKAAAKFLAENGKKPDVVTTASGLQYKVLAAGSGDSPKRTDEVTVNYRGTLLDGTEFDSSYKRGEPANFRVDRVIPGWTEALQLMKPGGKLQLYVPPQLAYDTHSRPPIPPGALLVFEVELIGVKPPEAAAEPARPGAPPPTPPPAPK